MEMTIERPEVVLIKKTIKMHLKEEEGDICVMATDAFEGAGPFYVARFSKDGTVSLIGCLPEDLGFRLNSNSQVVLVNYPLGTVCHSY